jgi:hypothetical protein
MSAAAIAAVFHRAHEQSYGYALHTSSIEVVTVQVTGTLVAQPVSTGTPETLPAKVTGPAVLPLATATLHVPAGWRGRRTPSGDLDLRLQ